MTTSTMGSLGMLYPGTNAKDPIQGGTYNYGNQKYDRKTSKQGKWTEKVVQNYDLLLDTNELTTRRNNAVEKKPIVAPYATFKVEQTDILVAKKGQKDRVPCVLSHCNGISKDEYPTPFDFMTNHYFVALADKDYPGDNSEKVMVGHMRGTFSFAPDQDVGNSTDMAWIPAVDYMDGNGDIDDYVVANAGVPNLMQWPDEQREIWFRLVPVNILKSAFKLLRSQTYTNMNVKDLITLLNRNTAEDKDLKIVAGKFESIEFSNKDKGTLFDVTRKYLQDNFAVNDKVVPVTKYHIWCALFECYDYLYQKEKAKMIDGGVELSTIKDIVGDITREDVIVLSVGDRRKMESVLVDPDYFVNIFKYRQRYEKMMKFSWKSVTCARTIGGCSLGGRVQSILLQ